MNDSPNKDAVSPAHAGSTMSAQVPSDRLIPAAAAVRNAAARLAGVLPMSRLILDKRLSARLGFELWYKLELENPTGSFKLRGAYNVLAGMSPDERSRGVVASSAGNHGLGVAYAARTFSAPASIYVPANAPRVKKDGIRALGASVNDDAPDYDAAMALALAHAREQQIRFINPCLGLDLLAGQGTVALEVLTQLPGLATMVVPVGGGGLLGGTAALLRKDAPGVRIIGVQSEATAAMTLSLKAGRVVEIPSLPTLADGLAGQIDQDGLEIGRYAADAMVPVSEDEVAESIVWARKHLGLLVEGAGAVGMAAVRYGHIPSLTGPVVVILSGGNLDESRFNQLLDGDHHPPLGRSAPPT